MSSSVQQDGQPLVLEGTPYQRGLIHGESLRNSIQGLVEIIKADLWKYHKMDLGEASRDFLGKRDYLPAIQMWTPDLLDEIRGIAAGAGIAWETALVLQLVDEFWGYLEEVFRGHCSSLGFPPSKRKPAMVAQTMDLEMFRDGSQVLLHIKHPNSDLEAYVLSFAGMIGLNGINNHGVAICCNALGHLNGSADGLPVACIVRGVLAQKSESDAVSFVRQIKHASGQNYVIGGPQGVYSFECSAHQVCRFEPGGGNGVVWHTNHPLISDDFTSEYRAALETTGAEVLHENSIARLQSLQRRAADMPEEDRLEGIQAALASKDSLKHPICGSKGAEEFYARIGVFTFGATIMVLSSEPEFHVALGPPDRNPYHKFTFPYTTR